MKDWKMIAISSSLAFIISLISGFFGSVSLGVLLLRALSGAVIFAALAFGVSILLRKYLPELYELQLETGTEIDEDLPDVQSVSKDSDSLPVPGAGIDISIDDGDKSVLMGMQSENDHTSNGSLDEGSDLIDEIPETEDTESLSGDGRIPEDIDTLPDMGVFSDSFKGIAGEDMDPTDKAGAVTIDIMGEEQDPEIAAKALRTMVKKDQVG